MPTPVTPDPAEPPLPDQPAVCPVCQAHYTGAVSCWRCRNQEQIGAAEPATPDESPPNPTTARRPGVPPRRQTTGRSAGRRRPR